MNYQIAGSNTKKLATLSLEMKSGGECVVTSVLSDESEYDLLKFTKDGKVLLFNQIDEDTGFRVDEGGCLVVEREV